MATPMPITSISLHNAAGRMSRRWRNVYGEDLSEIKILINKFLGQVPEYRAMPAYLLLGLGDVKPEGFEVDLAYMYKFYSKTANVLTSLMLEDAGEFSCTDVSPEGSYVFEVEHPEVADINRAIDEHKHMASKYMIEAERLQEKVHKYMMHAEERNIQMMQEEIRLENIPNTKEIDMTERVTEALAVMPKLGFQPVSVSSNEESMVIIFNVQPRKVYSAYAVSDKPVGKFHTSFLMKLGLMASGSILMKPYKKVTPSRILTPHPHISSNICWGGSNSAYDAAARKGNVKTVLTMFDTLLRTYNYKSPYISLKDYTEFANFKYACTETPEDIIKYAELVHSLSQFDLTVTNVLGSDFEETILKLKPELHSELTALMASDETNKEGDTNEE